MEPISSGNALLKSFSACLYQPPLKIRSSAFMEDFPQKWNLWIRLDLLIEFRISLTMAHFVTFCGQIQQTRANLASAHLQEALDIAGDKISQISSCTKTI